MSRKILILEGPGLDSTDGHDPAIGTLCDELGLVPDFRQSDDLEELCRWISDDGRRVDAVVINPGMQADGTPAGPVCRSAIGSIADGNRPVVEVHLHNIYRHLAEPADRPHQPVGDVGLVCGLGRHGYALAIRSIASRLAPQAAR